MARKPKDPSLRMTVDLRIPVTPAQKQTVTDAMAIDNREFASWARGMILDAAQEMISRASRRKARAGTKSDAGQAKTRG
jgi:hypothetical protein